MTTTRVTMIRLLVVLPLIGAACGDSSPSHPPPTRASRRQGPGDGTAVSPDDAAALAAGNLAFAVEMHLQLRATQPDNFIFSQTSISTALAMLYAGAATTTADRDGDGAALRPARRAPAPRLQRPRSRADDAARGQQRRRVPARGRELALGPGRLRRAAELPRHAGRELRRRPLRRGLRVECRRARATTINGWVSDRTEAQIQELFPKGSINALTRLVLANAVFFHGDWKTPFKHDTTATAPFHALTGDVSVPTMHGEHNARALERHRLECGRARLRRRHHVDDCRRPRRGNLRRLRGGPDRDQPRRDPGGRAAERRRGSDHAASSSSRPPSA